MNLIQRVILLIALALSISCPKDANAITGSDLLKHCTAAVHVADRQDSPRETNTFGAGFCVGLVQGVRNTNELYREIHKDQKSFFCVPDSVTNEQLIRVAHKYLYDHPENLHMNDTLLVMFSMQEAFPCQTP